MKDLVRIARSAWPVAAGLLLGLMIGGVWTILQSNRYRAESHVVLTGAPASRLAPAVATLANGSVVQENVRQTLRLSNPPDLSASVDRNILDIVAEAKSRERARQVDAEAAQVVTQLVAARFGSEGLHARLLDPAHVVEQTSPTTGRNLLICGLLGVLAGAALGYAGSRQRGVPVEDGVMDPNVERRLKKRISEVTKRERALARRAGELAQREAKVEQRGEELDQLQGRLKQRNAELGETSRQLAARAGDIAASERELEGLTAAPPPPPAPPEPVPATEAEAEPTASAQPGSWNLSDLQRAVDAHTGTTPEQIDNWRTYLFFIREHASPDGTLPRSMNLLIADVFAEILDHRTPS